MGGYAGTANDETRARYGLSDVIGHYHTQRWMLASNLNGYVHPTDDQVVGLDLTDFFLRRDTRRTTLQEPIVSVSDGRKVRA
jgi:hypothetical protein